MISPFVSEVESKYFSQDPNSISQKAQMLKILMFLSSIVAEFARDLVDSLPFELQDVLACEGTLFSISVLVQKSSTVMRFHTGRR